MCPNAMAQLETAKNDYIEQQQDLINDISYVSVRFTEFTGQQNSYKSKAALFSPFYSFLLVKVRGTPLKSRC